jgi:type IV pilus assembly protein PilW
MIRACKGGAVRAGGFSLIELMISLLLASFVLIAVVGLFNQSKGNQVQNEQIARMQENGRYALRLVARDLGLSGYWGGIIDPSLIDVSGASKGTDCLGGSGWMFDRDKSLELENDATASPYTCIDDDDILDGTDVIGIKRVADNADRYARTSVSSVLGSTNVGAIYLKVNGQDGALYNASGTADDGPTAIPKPFQSRQLYPEIFYVSPTFTLMRQTLVDDDMVAQPVIDGIENLQIEFGVDGTDTDVAPDYYTADPDSADVLDSVTARVYILVRSLEPIAGYVNDKTYNLGSTTVGPFNDAYYRRVYTTTVPLRNASKLKLQAI